MPVIYFNYIWLISLNALGVLFWAKCTDDIITNIINWLYSDQQTRAMNQTVEMNARF